MLSPLEIAKLVCYTFYMKREDFYLFLDFDGVLWDWKWRLNEIKHGRIKKGSMVNEFNPESIEALNTLLDYIGKSYECHLVISSSWRALFEHAKNTLIKNGVNLPNNIDKTPRAKKNNGRGEEILEYLKGKENWHNILIIDNDIDDIKKKFSSNQIIKTSIFDGALNKKQITTWINKREHELNITEEM